MPQKLTHNSARPARACKNDNIIDCFARPLPNAVRKMATVGSCPVRPTAVRHSPICHRVLSARLRPVLRRGASRCHFAWRACRPVPPHFGPGAAVVQYWPRNAKRPGTEKDNNMDERHIRDRKRKSAGTLLNAPRPALRNFFWHWPRGRS